VSYAPSAPAEIWAAKDIGAGTKITVMAMWSWADHDVQQSIGTTTVYCKMVPDRTPVESLIDRLVAQTGATPRAIREHLTNAKAEGYADVNGVVVTLHWPPAPRAKRDHGSGTRKSGSDCRDHVNVKAAARDVITAAGNVITAGIDVKPSAVDVITSSQLNPPSPQPPIPPQPPHAAGEPVVFMLTSPGSDPPPKRDLASEVLAEFNRAMADLRVWAGKPGHDPVTMTAERRREIAGRLSEIDGDPDHKLVLCRRVIAVQVHQVRSHGDRRKTEDFARDWKSMRTSTLFAAKNFTRWLDRWSEDGDHDLWFQTRASNTDHVGSGVGSAAKLKDLGQKQIREAPETIPTGPGDYSDGDYSEASYQ
jgi:hypothetical protein